MIRGSFSPKMGPEYISEKPLKWAEKHGITIQHIQRIHPGRPQQNADIERGNRVRHWARTNGAFNGSLRHAWLERYIIDSIKKARDHATPWLWTHNNDRPNMGIGGITPAQKLKMAG